MSPSRPRSPPRPPAVGRGRVPAARGRARAPRRPAAASRSTAAEWQGGETARPRDAVAVRRARGRSSSRTRRRCPTRAFGSSARLPRGARIPTRRSCCVATVGERAKAPAALVEARQGASGSVDRGQGRAQGPARLAGSSGRRAKELSLAPDGAAALVDDARRGPGGARPGARPARVGVPGRADHARDRRAAVPRARRAARLGPVRPGVRPRPPGRDALAPDAARGAATRG